MSQLKLTKEELIKIGFKECKGEADEMNVAKTYFKIETLNGYFYYNPKERVYNWYHKTIIGEVSNDVHLNLISKPELFLLLSVFNVKFNTVL